MTITKVIKAPRGTRAHFEPDGTDNTVVADHAEVELFAVCDPMDGNEQMFRALIYEPQTDIFHFAGDRSSLVGITIN